MIILTPSAVALRMECTTREAFRLMRRFGAIDCRDAAGKPSLRITEERFLECLSNAMASTNAARSGGSAPTRSPAKLSRRGAKTLRPLADSERSAMKALIARLEKVIEEASDLLERYAPAAKWHGWHGHAWERGNFGENPF